MSYKVESTSGWLDFLRFYRDPLAYVGDAGRRSVDVHAMRLGRRRLFQVNHPDLILDVLITHDRNFIKGQGLQAAKGVLGEGLLTSEGELHKKQRRLAQPAFHSARLASYARSMVGCAAEMRESWAAGEQYAIDREMRKLTLRIVGRTLFSAPNLSEDGTGVGRSLAKTLQMFLLLNSPLVQVMSPVRRWMEKRAGRARADVEVVLRKVIEEHRRSPEAYDDMLSMLMAAQEDGSAEQMTDQLLMDETLTMFLAGHETTANAMAWTCYLLAQHPEAMEKMQEELRRVLDGRLPTVEDLGSLAYTGWVFQESLRIYPPAWAIGREAVEDYQLGDVKVPAGASVMMSAYATQRDPRYWEAAEEFRPERWKDDAGSGRPRFAFYPFGAGTRVCIGEQFARMEGVLLLATLAQRWRPELMPGQKVKPWPRMTLRPKKPMYFRMERAG